MKIKKDKKLHFVAGILLGMLGATIAATISVNTTILILFAIITPMLGGIIKEIILDKFLKLGTTEIMDMLYTTFGGIFISIIILLFIII